jgi:hypothetical protein
MIHTDEKVLFENDYYSIVRTSSCPSPDEKYKLLFNPFSRKEKTLMKFRTDIACALGLLAGTTFGSGIAFLFGWQAYRALTSVAVFGVAGIIVTVAIFRLLHRKSLSTSGS